MTQFPFSQEMLDSYLVGTLDPDSVRAVEAYLKAHPARRASLAGIRASVRGEVLGAVPDPRLAFEELLPALLAEDDVDYSNRISTWVDASQSDVAAARSVSGSFYEPRYRADSVKGSATGRRNWWTLRWSVAAYIMPIFLVAFLIYQLKPARSAVEELRSYSTVVGQYKTLTLPNKTMVTLAPATTITVSANDVSVDGEAYFQVVSNAGKPFVVKTSQAEVRVLGTAFAVRHYTGEPQSRVVVDDGKVAVVSRTNQALQDARAVLTADMVGLISDSSVSVSYSANSQSLTSWRHGRLSFQAMPLRDVVVELGRAYGVSVGVTDSLLANQLVTATVSMKSESLMQVLELLGRVTNSRSISQTTGGFILLPHNRHVPASLTFPSQESTIDDQ